MTKDLPDFQSEIVSAAVEATSFRSGLDADKPASPAAGDIWLARDTFYLYVCFVAGSWEKVDKLYLELAGGTMSGAIAMGDNKITGLADPTAAQDAARKTEVDTVDAKLDDVSQAQPTRALDTNYQNSTKIRVVTVTFRIANGNAGGGDAYTGSSSPPTTIVATQYLLSGLTYEYCSLTFIVPPSWYYKVATLGVVTVYKWTEWDLH